MLSQITQALLHVVALAAVMYAGVVLWQLAMHGTPPSNPAWYLVAVPVALFLAAIYYVATRKKGGAA